VHNNDSFHLQKQFKVYVVRYVLIALVKRRANLSVVSYSSGPFGDNRFITLSLKNAANSNYKVKNTGVDVMITMFCDFRPFSANKFAFFSKINVMIKFMHYLALF
jgi:hypothetical protein